jgi:hypothetical protein
MSLFIYARLTILFPPFFLEQRMRKYLQGRRQVKGFGFRRWPSAKLYKELGLYGIPQHAPYRRARMP